MWTVLTTRPLVIWEQLIQTLLVMCEHYKSTITVWELRTPCDVWTLWKHYHWCLRTDNNAAGAVQTDRSPLGRNIQVIISQRNWFAIMLFNHVGRWEAETAKTPGTEIRKGILSSWLLHWEQNKTFPVELVSIPSVLSLRYLLWVTDWSAGAGHGWFKRLNAVGFI